MTLPQKAAAEMYAVIID